MRTRAAIVLLSVALFAVPLFAGAQASTTPPTSPGTGQLSACSTLYSISDYSVLFSSLQNITKLSAGDTLRIHAVINNKGQLPVVGGVLYAKVYRLSDPQNPAGDGVDFTQVAKGLDIAIGASIQEDFTYAIPANAPAGNYRIAAALVPGNGFDPEGVLVWNNPAANGILDITVASKEQGAITLMSTTTAVLAHPSQVASTLVNNSTEQSYTGSVRWSLYAWDATDPAKPISTQVEPFTVAAHSSATVSYSLRDTTHVAYEVVGEIDTPRGAKSFAGFPLWIDNQSTQARFSYVAASRMPLVAGEPAAFACFKSVGKETNVQVSLSVERTGWLSFLGPIGIASYQGPAPFLPSALVANATSPSSSFNVVARIYSGGQLLDSVTIPYQCGGANGPCGNSSLFYTIVTIVALIVLIGLFIWAYHRNNSMPLMQTPPAPFMSPPAAPPAMPPTTPNPPL